MSLLNNITERKYQLALFAEKLKEQKLPLLFYGAGHIASQFYNNFGKGVLSDVKIAEIVVSDEHAHKYYNKKFENREIFSMSDMLNKYGLCNIFLAFAIKKEEDKAIKEQLMATGKVANIYSFDMTQRLTETNVGSYYFFIAENEKILSKLYGELQDAVSKDHLVKFIEQSISGDTKYLESIELIEDQYFPEFVKIESDSEIFIDCGAYTGDTINSFIKNLGSKNYKHIYAFEPDSSNYAALVNGQAEQITYINKGVWSKSEILRFRSERGESSGLHPEGDVTIAVESIDNVLNGGKASFIKMDIEGAELEALKGAEKTIRAYKPKLAICVYHTPEDLITIPQYIKHLVPEYKLYLRAHTNFIQELVLYAVF